MLHTLFVREHNAICDQARRGPPRLGRRALFQVARLVNAAVMAKIHTIEWTPAILPNRLARHGPQLELVRPDHHRFRKPATAEIVVDSRSPNPELGGIVGNHINVRRAYGLTEEFTAVYRLHSLLPETLVSPAPRRDRDRGSAPRRDPASGSPKLTARTASTDLLYSFGNQHPGALVLNNYPRLVQDSPSPASRVDMAAVDLLRDRERGMPRYNELRRQIGLSPIDKFDDLTDDSTVAATKEVVRRRRGKLDLLIGTLAEAHRPSDFGFGETLFQIFILNASAPAPGRSVLHRRLPRRSTPRRASSGSTGPT